MKLVTTQFVEHQSVGSQGVGSSGIGQGMEMFVPGGTTTCLGCTCTTCSCAAHTTLSTHLADTASA